MSSMFVYLFLTFVIAVNIILVATFTAFEIDIESLETYDEDNLLEILTIFIEGVISDIEAILDILEEIPFIGFIFDIGGDLILGLIEFIQEAISIWAIVPSQLFYVLLVPFLGAGIYALIEVILP